MNPLPFSRPLDYEALVSCAAPGEGHWFVFRGDQLLVEMGPLERASDDLRVKARPAWARLPHQSALQKSHDWLGAAPLRILYLGLLQGKQCWAAEVAKDAPAPQGMSFEGLRTLFSVLDDAHFALTGRALQLVEWDRTHQFCGRCGSRTEAHREERVRVCPACKLSAYPRVAPAVMALVKRRSEILLARSPHFPPGMYSALAGFVEPGESLEDAVRREVAEEVGVEVGAVTYLGNQPWPFPASLMVGFFASARSTEISVDGEEISDARWFTRDQVRAEAEAGTLLLPGGISISRTLVETWYGDRLPGHW
ncbi:MAG: NAD(+) diphosphatase [Nocardioidaceae bacterium]